MSPRENARTRWLRLALVVLAVLAGLEIGARFLDRFRGAPFDAESSRREIESTLRTLSQGAFIPGWPRDAGLSRETSGPRGAGGTREESGLRDGSGSRDGNGLREGGLPRERTATEAGAMKLHPYLGYQHPQTSAWIEADLAYYKTPEAERALDVCILGGSVAYMLATVGEKALVAELSRDPALAGREVRVHNYALGGYKEPQQLMLLLWLLDLGQEPDVVLNLDGANEAALGRSNLDGGTHPAYPYLPRWTNVTLGMRSDEAIIEKLHEVRAAQEAARAFAARFLGSGLWRSAFLERAGSLRLESLRARYSAAHAELVDAMHDRPRDPEIAGPKLTGGEDDLVRTVATCWEECSVGLQAICAEHGITYLHVLQPTLFDAGSKPLTQKEIDGAKAEPGWADGIPQIYPALREAGRHLEARGIAFLDATQVFRDHEEDLYFDMCHFGERGNEILAGAIAPRLLALLPK